MHKKSSKKKIWNIENRALLLKKSKGNPLKAKGGKFLNDKYASGRESIIM